MAHLRGILVDPHTRSVSIVELPEEGSYETVLGVEGVDFDTLRLADDHGPGLQIVVDEWGLSAEGQKFWSFKVRPDRIYGGKGLIFAFDDEGETIDNPVDPGQVLERVNWLSIRLVRLDHETRQEGDRVHIAVKPVFEPVPET